MLTSSAAALRLVDGLLGRIGLIRKSRVPTVRCDDQTIVVEYKNHRWSGYRGVPNLGAADPNYLFGFGGERSGGSDV
jgi:hypothetical protein